jgi:REP element-mobilizing transposase RayT
MAWKICIHAESYSSVLRPSDESEPAFETVGALLKTIASKNWPRREQHPLWQRDFWDTQLRRSENYESKWLYVVNNPVRAGLSKCVEEWPFQGELNVLEW